MYSPRCVLISYLAENPQYHVAGCNQISLQFSEWGAWGANQRVLGVWLQNKIADELTFSKWRIDKWGGLSFGTRFRCNDGAQVQSGRFSTVGYQDTKTWNFSLFDDYVGSVKCPNPSTLFISERIFRILGGFFKIFLGSYETGLRDDLLRHNSFGIVSLRLDAGVLHFSDLLAHYSQLFESRNGISSQNRYSQYFKHEFHYWSLIWTAMMGLVLMFLGYYHLSVDGWDASGWWLAGFLVGIGIWGYSISTWLSLWLRL